MTNPGVLLSLEKQLAERHTCVSCSHSSSSSTGNQETGESGMRERLTSTESGGEEHYSPPLFYVSKGDRLIESKQTGARYSGENRITCFSVLPS